MSRPSPVTLTATLASCSALTAPEVTASTVALVRIMAGSSGLLLSSTATATVSAAPEIRPASR